MYVYVCVSLGRPIDTHFNIFSPPRRAEPGAQPVPEALAQLPAEALAQLPSEAGAQLPAEALTQLPAEAGAQARA